MVLCHLPILPYNTAVQRSNLIQTRMNVRVDAGIIGILAG